MRVSFINYISDTYISFNAVNQFLREESSFSKAGISQCYEQLIILYFISLGSSEEIRSNYLFMINQVSNSDYISKFCTADLYQNHS